MRYLLLLIGLFSTTLKAQNTLTFNKRFVECEDKWVANKMNEDSTYPYGFIYIDESAGLTLDVAGSFKITADNIFIPKKFDSFSVKVRLENNNVKVAIIPPSKYKELQITEYPDWLKNYEPDTPSVKRLYRWGYMYNGWDLCEKALTYLEKAEKIDPDFPGLKTELAYAYNDLGKYDSAIVVLKSAIATSINNCYFYKELAYAQMHLGQLDSAAQTYKQSVTYCTDKPMKCEIAHNIAYQYFQAKDKINFEYWAGETKKWATNGDKYMNSINKLEADFGK